MSAWSYRTEETVNQEYDFPINAEMHDRLSVKIHSHDLPLGNDSIPCWTYVTSGLMSAGQAEMILTIQRRPTETIHEFPEEVLLWFTQIFQWATEGMIVHCGGRSTLQSGHFITPGMIGVLYQNAQPLKGIDVPPGALCMVPVTNLEMIASEEFGQLRILSLLGNKFCYYPFPPWFDRAREGTVDAKMLDDMSVSLCARMPRVIVRGLRVIKHGTTLHALVVPENVAGFRQMFSSMPPDMFSLRISVDLDENADACLVWQPQGATLPHAITKPLDGMSGVRSTTNIRVGGTFLCIVVSPDGLAYRVLEDGFALMITEKEWSQLRDALQAGSDLEIDLAEDTKFKLTWDHQ